MSAENGKKLAEKIAANPHLRAELKSKGLAAVAKDEGLSVSEDDFKEGLRAYAADAIEKAGGGKVAASVSACGISVV